MIWIFAVQEIGLRYTTPCVAIICFSKEGTQCDELFARYTHRVHLADFKKSHFVIFNAMLCMLPILKRKILNFTPLIPFETIIFDNEKFSQIPVKHIFQP